MDLQAEGLSTRDIGEHLPRVRFLWIDRCFSYRPLSDVVYRGVVEPCNYAKKDGGCHDHGSKEKVQIWNGKVAINYRGTEND